MAEFKFQHETLILDASPLICLYASGHMKTVLASISKTITVAAYVKNVEVTHIYNQPVQGNEEPTESIDLQPIIADRLLSVVDLEDEQEAISVINLVALMGQGEAITGAIADTRKWAIGIDDRKARRIFAEQMPHLQLVMTLDLIRHWEATANPTSVTMKLVLENIRDRAQYKPKSNHPHYEWWMDCINHKT